MSVQPRTRVPQANGEQGRFLTTPNLLVEPRFSKGELKRCNVCDRPGVYVVTFTNLKVRYCWKCLPAEQRHYLRVNY